MYKEHYIRKSFKFNASHAVKINGATEAPHTHTFYVSITYKGKKNQDGIIVDFKDLNEFIKREILGVLDGRDLNKIFSNPTTENIAEFIWSKAYDFNKDIQLTEVRVCETQDSCIYIKENNK